MIDCDIEFQPFIRKLISRKELTEGEIETSIDLISTNKVSHASIVAFLVALTMKRETANELRCLIKSVKERSIRLTPNVNSSIVDICGTGGDSINTPNISTAAALVASGSGACVAKHGNKSMSGLCGSADFLEYVGFDLNTSPTSVLSSIEQIGVGFIYAPKFHPAMAAAAAARKIIGARTLFNIVGPLSNPCTNLSGQVIGVTDTSLFETISEASLNLGIRNVMVVHAHDGIDELSNTCPNDISLKDGNYIKRFHLDPKDVNLDTARSETLAMKTREQSIRVTLRCIYGQAERDLLGIVELNAAAALVVANKASDLSEGIEIARESIREGRAKKKLSQLIEHCGRKRRLQDIEEDLELESP
jgi:anthranilate phosphoribosyltransferase